MVQESNPGLYFDGLRRGCGHVQSECDCDVGLAVLRCVAMQCQPIESDLAPPRVTVWLRAHAVFRDTVAVRAFEDEDVPFIVCCYAMLCYAEYGPSTR